jgi:hypothetical protein
VTIPDPGYSLRQQPLRNPDFELATFSTPLRADTGSETIPSKQRSPMKEKTTNQRLINDRIESSENEHNDSVHSYEMKIRESSQIGTNHLKLSLAMNILLLCGYFLLFAVKWYEYTSDAGSFSFSILSVQIVTPSKIQTARTSTFLSQDCYGMLPSETCDSFTNLDTCFTVFIIFKSLSVLLNLSSIVGLVYLIRKR